MHDGANGTGLSPAEDTFEALRRDFVEDAAEELHTLVSYLNEAAAGNRTADAVVADARRVAVMLTGGASSFELPLVGVAAQRFDDYIASLTSAEGRVFDDLGDYAEKLLDLLSGVDEPGEDDEASAAQLMRQLPAKGNFDADQVTLREIEVLLVMQPGIATRVIERELQECGYRVTSSGNCFKALELASRTLPDLMIISAVMPDLEGIDLAIALKAMPATRNIGAAVITSLDRDDPRLQQLPPTVPIIQKSQSFGDDLTQALQDQFLL